MPWRPIDPQQPHLLDRWRPFLLAARRAREEGSGWVLDPLDFRLIGHVERKAAPTVWVYVHQRTEGDLCVDDQGRCYRVKLDRAYRIRCKETSVLSAVWRTGVPQMDGPLPEQARRAYASPSDLEHEPVPARRPNPPRHLRVLPPV